MKTIPLSRLLTFVLLLLTGLTSTLRSQTKCALLIDRNIRFKAIDITSEYQPRLVMGVNQALEFQQTVARFLVKKKAVEDDTSLSPKGRYELLKRISSRETAEMAQVLESYQWQEYRRIKNEIQSVPMPYSLKEDLIAQKPPTIE
ncbi:MAG: hypothetical protein WBM83_09435 [Flavobacteriaceae bacterium]